MAQQTSTFLMRGGLNLVSPPIAIPPGQAIGAINYEADVAGYTSVAGYERYDGQPRPSDTTVTADIAARRALITEVPGTGPVRGVQVFAGHVYAFRDHSDGVSAGMYRDSTSGWAEMTFGSIIYFSSGVTAFAEGETLVGSTSAATAIIDRVVLQSGAWDGTAGGYLIVSDILGTFETETMTSTTGEASGTAAEALAIAPGGHYDFTTHNFYGAAEQPCLYVAYGQGPAFEWTGEVLSPIYTGTVTSSGDDINIVESDGDFVVEDDGDYVVIPMNIDRPTWINHFKNHLFVGYSQGTVICSSIGEPLEYITTTGAFEFAFGSELTGILSAATSMVIFGRGRIDYLIGNDSSDFVMQPITDNAGAFPYSLQMVTRPIYLDDGGVRDIGTTSSFGDWKSGTLTQTIEPLILAKRNSGVSVAASMVVRAKDQYRLFFDDGTGITLYLGRKAPEPMPFNLPVTVFCACSGEMSAGAGDRHFVGGTDGFVYEFGCGTSFDGESIQTYARLPFNSMSSPTTNKRYNKFSADVICEDDIDFGLVFDLDYARGLRSSQTTINLDAGSPIVTTELYGTIADLITDADETLITDSDETIVAFYSNIDWAQAVSGFLEAHIDGIGRNIAVTLITDSALNRPHTLASGTFNFAPRGMIR